MPIKHIRAEDVVEGERTEVVGVDVVDPVVLEVHRQHRARVHAVQSTAVAEAVIPTASAVVDVVPRNIRVAAAVSGGVVTDPAAVRDIHHFAARDDPVRAVMDGDPREVLDDVAGAVHARVGDLAVVAFAELDADAARVLNQATLHSPEPNRARTVLVSNGSAQGCDEHGASGMHVRGWGGGDGDGIAAAVGRGEVAQRQARAVGRVDQLADPRALHRRASGELVVARGVAAIHNRGMPSQTSESRFRFPSK